MFLICLKLFNVKKCIPIIFSKSLLIRFSINLILHLIEYLQNLSVSFLNDLYFKKSLSGTRTLHILHIAINEWYECGTKIPGKMVFCIPIERHAFIKLIICTEEKHVCVIIKLEIFKLIFAFKYSKSTLNDTASGCPSG